MERLLLSFLLKCVDYNKNISHAKIKQLFELVKEDVVFIVFPIVKTVWAG